MSTLTRRPSGNNKIPDYKDYMSFVSAYRNGKKETHYSNQDQVVVTSNINSVVTDEEPDSMVHPNQTKAYCESFSNFLEKTKTKKFVSVRPPIQKKPIYQEKQPLKKTVKTEIYLEINNEEEHRRGDVCELRGMFEKSPEKFENIVITNVNNNNNSVINKGVEAKKKLFENGTSTNNMKTFNETSKEMKNSNIKPLANIEKKIQILSSVETKNSHNSNSSFLHKTKTISDKLEKNSSCQQKIHDIVDHRTEKSEQNIEEVEKCRPTTENNAEEKEENLKKQDEIMDIFIPVPPVMPEVMITEIKNPKIVEQNAKKSFVPPPPPAMPANFNIPPVRKTVVKTSQTLPRISNINNKPPTENVDPLVKKLAYGAMLDMYGAYHNKANSYVATLPKNRVKKDGNLQKIIDNIAAQGGLEKLSGRTNPKDDFE